MLWIGETVIHLKETMINVALIKVKPGLQQESGVQH